MPFYNNHDHGYGDGGQSVLQPRPPLIEAIHRHESDSGAPGYAGKATRYRREPGKLGDYGTVDFGDSLLEPANILSEILDFMVSVFPFRIDEQQRTWPGILRSAKYACNNAPSATTGMSPFQAFLGFNPNFQIRAGDGSVEKEAPAAQHRFEKLTELREKLPNHKRPTTTSVTKK
ncbi:hypothetical protein N7536_001308 [Penicillium majusculum]|nr:hypothetical protein N7536_001308 [Penicillium majusculum]